MSNCIVLAGGMASGKTCIAKYLEEKKGYRRIITYTTRPMRDGEVDGVDYHFLTDEEFLTKRDKGFFAESTGHDTIYGRWYYGSAFDDYHKPDKKVIVLNPRGVMNLKVPAFVVYLDISDDILTSRAVERGDDVLEVERRLKKDKEHFKTMLEVRYPDVRVRRAMPIVTTVDYILMKQEAASRNLHTL